MYKREKRSLVSGIPGHIATNYTRFVVISKDVLPHQGDKMTLVIITEHVPGALYKALEKLEGQCKYFNILGTYRAAENRL